MKILSIRQPWAWAIIHAEKDIENRGWPTNFRGKFLIHAGKKFDREGYEWLKEEFPNIACPDEFLTGGVIGSAEIVDCVQKHNSRWFFGPFGFVLRNSLPEVFTPMKGQLGFFDSAI